MSTLFEKIISREIPAEILFEDDLCIVIKDIFPQAPVHFLAIPKKVIARINQAEPSDAALVGHLILTGTMIAGKLGVAETGFRIVVNNGPDAGESVPHLHVHFLGGRSLAWPPG